MKTKSFDLDNSIVTEWLRMGACNDCRECSQVMIITTDGKGWDDTEASELEERGDEKRGIWHQWDIGCGINYSQLGTIVYDYDNVQSN